MIDAHRVARDAGLAGQINVVMQVCCFALTNLMPLDAALDAIRASVRSVYGKRGGAGRRRQPRRDRRGAGGPEPLVVPIAVTATRGRRSPVPADASDFVQRVTARMLAGEGDLLPVSALPVDGTFPTGTARVEKRSLAAEIPIWDPEICIDCARCALVCPHAAIRMKIHDPAATADVVRMPRSRASGSDRMTIPACC